MLWFYGNYRKLFITFYFVRYMNRHCGRKSTFSKTVAVLVVPFYIKCYKMLYKRNDFISNYLKLPLDRSIDLSSSVARSVKLAYICFIPKRWTRSVWTTKFCTSVCISIDHVPPENSGTWFEPMYFECSVFQRKV